MRRKTYNRRLILTVLIALLGIQFSFAVVYSDAADNPHNRNSSSPIDCVSCHDDTKVLINPEWWSDQAANVCGQCHNTGTGTDVVSHKHSPDSPIQCTSCHDPHRQMQARTWKALSYHDSGASDLVGGIDPTRTVLTSSGKSWTVDQWKGMVLIPNINAPAYNYRILSNTANTITIDSSGTGDNLMTYAKGGQTFAIVYGRLVKSLISGKYVKFFRQTGADSFADGDAAINGVCQVCHTATKYFRRDGSVIDAGHTSAAAGSNCATCHTHQVGFAADCTTCHGNPPVNASTLVTTDGSVFGDTNSQTAGAHARHATAAGLNYGCTVCHGDNSAAGKHNADGTRFTITMGFDGLARNGVDPATLSGYNGQSLAAYDYDNTVTVTSNTGTAGSGTLTCSNIYCHSTAQAADGTNAPTYRTPVWDSPGSMNCGSCHVEMAGASATGSHTTHMGAVGAGVSGCGDCHPGAANDGSAYNPVLHVDYSVDVVAALNYSLGGTPGNGYGQCSTSACHSNGKGTYSSATWGSTSPGCTFCHPVLSGKHASHVVFTNGSVYGNTGVASTAASYDFGCGNCHPTSAAANHMNGSVEISLNPADGGTLKSKNSGPLISGSGNTTQCSGVYCHSNGQATPAFVQTPQWGGGFADSNNTCSECHGNSPATGAHALHAVGIHFEDVYSGSIGKRAATGIAGSGAAHGDPAVSATISCNICHAATLSKSRNKYGTACSGCHSGDDASTAIVSADLLKTAHVNGSRNVSFAAVQIKSNAQIRDNIANVVSLDAYWQRMNNYKTGAASHDQARATLAATAGYAGGSCSAVTCHNGFTVNWTDTISCDGCHTQLP